MDLEPQAVERLQFESRSLMADHPPIWKDQNKRVVFSISCPPGCVHQGRLEYSRWRAGQLRTHVEETATPNQTVGTPGFYDYSAALPLSSAVEWHVNFADPHLFVAYGSSLFAQDEMQVAEHPALGALREALRSGGSRAFTVENGTPTPVLVMGVERRCRVAIDPNELEWRPRGLYGNQFSRATPEAVRRATSRLDPPTTTNLIAMAAPSGGDGRYTRAEVSHAIVTAYTAFKAAALESYRSRAEACPVAVHTGFWGCGAFGGHRVLMAMLQVLASRLAGVDCLVFHTGDRSGAAHLDRAKHIIEQDLRAEPGTRTAELIDRVVALGFEWGVSDGN